MAETFCALEVTFIFLDFLKGYFIIRQKNVYVVMQRKDGVGVCLCSTR